MKRRNFIKATAGAIITFFAPTKRSAPKTLSNEDSQIVTETVSAAEINREFDDIAKAFVRSSYLTVERVEKTASGCKIIPSEVCPAIKILDDPFCNEKGSYHLSIKYKGNWFYLQNGLDRAYFIRHDLDEWYRPNEFMVLLWQEDNKVT